MINRLIFPLFTCVLLLNQCKPSEQKVTRQDAAAFIAGIEQAAIKHRPDFITSNFIIQALGDRMARVKEIKYQDAIEKGMAKGLQKSEFDRNIYQIVGKHGSFEKVKQYEKDGVQRVIFRAFGDEGINYLDMELTKLNDKVGIADMLIYTSGENFSKSLAETVSKLMDAPDASGNSSTLLLQSVKRLMQNGKYEAAKKEFDRLPSDIKNTRLAEVLNIQIASNLDEEIYIKAISRFQEKFSNEPNIQLTLLDLYILRKEYDNALSAINQVDSLINKDPFLNYYRGLINFVKGDKEKAMGYYQQVTQSHPGFPGAYAELVGLYAEKGDVKNVKRCFSIYKSLRNADEEVISNYEMLYPYVKEQ